MKILSVVAVVAMLLGAAWWYLFEYDALPTNTAYSVDWERARALAASGGPESIHSERVAEGEFFDWMLVAGGGWSRRAMEFRSFQLVYADDRTIMIDAVHGRVLHDSLPLMGAYDAQAWERQLQALREASQIVLTHEHYDHIGGLAPLLQDERVAARMFITHAQRSSGHASDAGIETADFAQVPASGYTNMHALAPGVVLIAAPGHTPGSQIIYVRLASGVEYAFIGDIVWNGRNLRERRAKGKLIGLLAGENRAQLDPQIAWFADQHAASPIHLVLAHDPDWNEALLQRGLLESGLQLRSP